ncbi:hypothetical protein CAPTEDRAFT_206136 [Capitella teleta]|uniref:Apple domain-containing protein n=1 Tax=Capitella teleta TaxID=283909 RepID=R7UR22_CAPTE|nr:hypothetical protein CAPTEDRAFT_206136 [Capitella teleta]|eukprot:ELU05876.1 hypothetical protein CAPTEDRAFT_206136 [Capitella teleta]
MKNARITRVCILAFLATVTHALLDGCSWVNVRAKRLVSWNNATVKIGIIETCKFTRDPQKGFMCRSVDFSRWMQACVLSEGDRADPYLSYSNNWQYNDMLRSQSFLALQNIANALPDGCSWVNFRSKRLMAWNKVVIRTEFLKTCQFACEHHKGFKCRSVDFSPKERACVLSDGDRVDSYLRDYKWNNWQYSEIQCKDELSHFNGDEPWNKTNKKLRKVKKKGQVHDSLLFFGGPISTTVDKHS